MLVVSIILVMMALLFWICGRTHETGILLAIGKSKAIIIVSTQ
ncbi:TPA: permease [Streptococcus agalactiae]